ncbi:hypothetical protein Dimus_018876 [Dionaea muscipula]
MASGTLGDEETRERHQWNASSKVYTRKIKNKQNSGASQNGQTKCNSSAVNNGNGSATNGDITLSSNGNTTTSNHGDVSVVINGDTPTANYGDTTMANNGDTAITDKGDPAIPDNGDAAIPGNGDAAIQDNRASAIQGKGDAAIQGDGDAVIQGNSDTGITVDGDTGIPENGDTGIPENGDTAIPDTGDTVMVDIADTAVADDDTAMADNGATTMPDTGDTAMADNGDTRIASIAVTTIVSNGDAAKIDYKNVTHQSEAPQTKDMNSLPQGLLKLRFLPPPQQLQKGGQSPQHLQEGVRSPQQRLEGWRSPEQLEGEHSPQQLREGGQQLQEGGCSPQQLEGRRAPQQLDGGRSPQHLEHDQSPQHLECDQSPQHLEHDQSPQHLEHDHSPQQLQEGGGTGGLTQRVGDEKSPQQLQEAVSHLEAGSGDTSSLNQMETGFPDSFVGSKENRSVKPIATRVDDRVSINLVVARSAKQEVRDLKRKLMGELDEVRNLVKKLEEKEIQHSNYSIGVGVNGVAGAGRVGLIANDVDIGGYSNVQYLANHRAQTGSHIGVNQKVSLVGVNNARSNRQLAVSVIDRSHGVSEIMEKEKRTPKANQFYRNSDFILGKEKLPPAEGNKKMKSSSKKRGAGELNYGFGMDKHIIKSCGKLLQKLMKHKYGWVFNKPVDVKGLCLHDYYDIIKHPMDLGTVKNRLTKNWYKSPREFADDVRLTFRNAMTYNPKGQDVHYMAEQLFQLFEENWVDISAQYNHRMRYVVARDTGLLTPTSRKDSMLLPAHVSVSTMSAPSASLLNPPPVHQEMRTLERSESMTALKSIYNAPVGRTAAPKKPKAKDPDKRDMTFEEKQRLSSNLQGLPSEKLDNIVQIIKRRNSAFSQNDDEIEVDIDRVDTETLWDLDRFVTNYKKSLSKNKRKAELALQRAEAARALQETNRIAPQVEAPTEVRAGENKATASPVHAETHPDNASQSSSSSSSSSDSGSSSSDSDSDSSSESSSDEGH